MIWIPLHIWPITRQDKTKTVFLILMVCANIFLSISRPEDGVLWPEPICKIAQSLVSVSNLSPRGQSQSHRWNLPCLVSKTATPVFLPLTSCAWLICRQHQRLFCRTDHAAMAHSLCSDSIARTRWREQASSVPCPRLQCEIASISPQTLLCLQTPDRETCTQCIRTLFVWRLPRTHQSKKNIERERERVRQLTSGQGRYEPMQNQCLGTQSF